MRNTLIIACLCTTFGAYAQSASIKKIELAGENIVVHYDLEDSNPNNDYKIDLFSSNNNFATALNRVTGDVGSEVKPGAGKKIIWNAQGELGAFKGKLSLEIRGKVYTPVVKIANISPGDKLKRGKTHTITWKAGNTNPIHIELMKGGQRISGELNQPNNGRFSLFIAAHASLGKDYRIKITDSRNEEDVVVSHPFRVTAKVPLLFKVLPLAVVGGAVVLLAGEGQDKRPKPLPEPPEQN
jgi:hypothetical protein